MNNAAKAEAPKEKTAPDCRKPQNPEALRSQEQKVTHDKVSRQVDIARYFIARIYYLLVINERRYNTL